MTGGDSTKRASPARWVVPLGAVLVVVGVGTAGLAFKPWRSKAAAIAPTETATPIAPGASPETPRAPAAPTLRTVQVSIAPADAKVEVDGRPVDLKDGKVEVRATVGSVHSVRVIAGGLETRADVAIAETGPIPERVELVVPKASGGGPRPTPRTLPAAAVATTGGVTAPAATPPRPSSAAPSSAALPTRSCDPPYTINSAGRHVLKPGCE